jgi:hypothetical protein
MASTLHRILGYKNVYSGQMQGISRNGQEAGYTETPRREERTELPLWLYICSSLQALRLCAKI